MINQKYYEDVKNFPSQFKVGFSLSESLPTLTTPTKVIICGMGGSALYIDLVNDYLASKGSSLKLYENRTYTLPSYVDKDTLVVLASHSGNTEETLSCAKETLDKKLPAVVFSAGGKLLQFAQDNQLPFVVIPKGCQPRLSTGYFIAALLSVLTKAGLCEESSSEVIQMAEKMDRYLDEEYAKRIANEMVEKVPLIYATDNNASIARISKIKFNENSKIQSFWNYFPELNHNEMVGFTKMVMSPYFLIFKSKFTHSRNLKRIEIFSRLMADKGLNLEVVDMQGDSVLEEILNAYYFVDHITYYLAENYGIDPEPVDMVEDFKVLMG